MTDTGIQKKGIFKSKNNKVTEESSIQISKKSNILWHIIFIVLSIICLYPMILVLMVTVTDETVIALEGYKLIPSKFSLQAVKFIVTNSSAIINAYGVSIFCTLVGGLSGVLIMALYAYPLARDDFKYRRIFNLIAVITMMFSGGFVPTYIVYTTFLHLKDTIWALIIMNLFSAFNVMIIRTYYRTSISKSLIEAAQIDGAGEFRTYFKIVLPLSKPVIATMIMMVMLVYWNDWFGPMLYIDNEKLYNLQYLMYQLESKIANLSKMAGNPDLVKNVPSETARMAMAIVAIGPIILAYPFFQRYFEKGITLGATKE